MARKRRAVTFIVILYSLLSFTIGCAEHPDSAKDTINEIVESYYKRFEPTNEGELMILAQRPLDDKVLVLAEKYSGDGHSSTELFLINSEKSIEKRATGFTPLSMCFTVNLLEYENNAIVFGSFNDTKWEIETDTKKTVDIQSILIKFKNGEIIEEPVGLGYIISLKPVAEVEAIELYDHNGLLQSDLNDLRRYGSVFTETSFIDIL
ncbi:hypothetical protein Dhaf_0975 [Desulfitobacterium hafniense DCB-2]|uniref:Prokaryotic membrane lipoprotein lipid attachment site profile n=1 Tax=Desulfitobacterium hafniense (strain DSM 10664 / DCB-2) TaxID=272564 RepID=B8FYE8_DESHD|nr:hypothetical protein [Desulfitobacterium hafniense]ACL19035.1 hypothetical protein Dhaf_0975 [Desulfitobacterium hafniense DCB-2]